MSKDDYTQRYGDFYGTVKTKSGNIKTVPFLQFQRKGDKKTCRIPVKVFNMLFADGMGYSETLEDHAQWYERMIAEADKREDEQKGYPIHNLKDYIDYLFAILPEETVEEIKKQSVSCKDTEEIINLFSEIYRGLLKLRHEYDINGDKRFDLGSMQKTVAKQMPDMPRIDYNPDAFIEPGE